MPTLRQSLARIIAGEPTTARDLASALLLTPREVEEHLAHLARTHKGQLKISPAVCQDCGYTFRKRSRLDAPGRCPSCRGQRIEGPWFHLPS